MSDRSGTDVRKLQDGEWKVCSFGRKERMVARYDGLWNLILQEWDGDGKPKSMGIDGWKDLGTVMKFGSTIEITK